MLTPRSPTEAVEPGPGRRFLLNVLIAFLPAAVVGLLAHDWIEEHLFRPGTVAASLIVGGVLILMLDGPDGVAASPRRATSRSARRSPSGSGRCCR